VQAILEMTEGRALLGMNRATALLE
jgi:hypothetical protein